MCAVNLRPLLAVAILSLYLAVLFCHVMSSLFVCLFVRLPVPVYQYLFVSLAHLSIRSTILVCVKADSLLSHPPSPGLACHVNITAAVAATPDNGAVAWLAQGYPTMPTPLNSSAAADAIATMTARHMRLFLEFPAQLDAAAAPATPAVTVWERAVVAAGATPLSLPALALLHPHEIAYVNLSGSPGAGAPWLQLAKMAGFDTAVDGIPTTAVPLLFAAKVTAQASSLHALVASTALSRFRVGRFGPHASWEVVWTDIMRYVHVTGLNRKEGNCEL